MFDLFDAVDTCVEIQFGSAGNNHLIEYAPVPADNTQCFAFAREYTNKSLESLHLIQVLGIIDLDQRKTGSWLPE